jgi:DNA-binding response OmpR family regulator
MNLSYLKTLQRRKGKKLELDPRVKITVVRGKGYRLEVGEDY